MGLLKDLGKQQEKVDRIPIPNLGGKNITSWNLELEKSNAWELTQSMGKITSSGLHSVPVHSNSFWLDSIRIQFDRMELNPIRWRPILSIRMPTKLVTPIQLMALVQCRVNPIQWHWMVNQPIHLLDLRPRRLII